MTSQTAPLSAKTIWGKIVLYLRENKQVALHVACGDITDVYLDGDNLVVNIYDKMLENLLLEGRREIERAISWQGANVNLVLRCVAEKKSPQEQDVEKLKKLFGNQITIK